MDKIQDMKNLILLVVMVISLSVNIVLADTESTSTGIFNVVGSYSSSIKIVNAGTFDVPHSLIPQKDYDIKVMTVCDTGLGNLDSVSVKMWLDSDGFKVNEADFNNVTDINGANAVEIIWNTETKEAVINSGEDTSWKLSTEDCVLPDEEVLNDPSITQYQFVFRVTIGKVARMTKINEKWQIAFQAIDESGTDYGYLASGENPGLAMEWYAEVESPKEIYWGNISPGIDYIDEGAKLKVESVRYISNGNYNEQVKFGNSWDANNSESSAVLTDEPINSNEFALRICKSDDVDSAKQIPDDESYVTTAEQNLPTSYEGATVTTYHLYIKLNKEFSAGKYSGNITFGVSN